MSKNGKQPERIWDNMVVIGHVQKAPALRLEIQLTTRDGVKYVNIREQYKRKKDETWMPGLKGCVVPITLPTEQGDQLNAANELLDMIKLAIEESVNFKLYDEANAVYSKPKEA